jgi:hypothetical protein
MPDLSTLACPQCHQPIQPAWYFCPNCGKDLQQKPRPTTALAQVGIYALSVFLPPLGLWPGIKYLREADPRAKQIGMIAIGLTVVSTIVTVWITVGLLQSYVGTINQSLGGLGG